MRKPSQKQLNYIQERILIHKERAANFFGEENIIGVFLFGSWNLGSWYEKSDVDTIVLVNTIQSFEEILYLQDNTGEVSYHISINRLLDQFIKGDKISVNTLEILETPYNWINPEFNSLFIKLKQLLPKIIDCKKIQIYNSELHNFTKLLIRLRSFLFSNTKDKNYKNQLHWKKIVYHALQSEYLLKSWLFYISWEESVFYSQEQLVLYKTKPISLEEAYQSIIESRERFTKFKFQIKNSDSTQLHKKLKILQKGFKEFHNIYKEEIKKEYYD